MAICLVKKRRVLKQKCVLVRIYVVRFKLIAKS